MANPPITIGPFANVPAPGSPIKSDWPQQTAQYIYDKVPLVLSSALVATVTCPASALTTALTYTTPSLPLNTFVIIETCVYYTMGTAAIVDTQHQLGGQATHIDSKGGSTNVVSTSRRAMVWGVAGAATVTIALNTWGGQAAVAQPGTNITVLAFINRRTAVNG